MAQSTGFLFGRKLSDLVHGKAIPWPWSKRIPQRVRLEVGPQGRLYVKARSTTGRFDLRLRREGRKLTERGWSPTPNFTESAIKYGECQKIR